MPDEPEKPDEPIEKDAAEAQPDEPEDDEEFDEFEDYEVGEPEGGHAYTTAEFHNVIHKQIVNATLETLSASKLDWVLVEPFLRAARDMCRGDFRRTGRVEIHGAAQQDDAWVDAEEAYVSVSVADQDDGTEWLTETWWLSDLVLAGGDPAQVRDAVRALERTVAKLNTWLDSNQTKGPDEAG